MITTETIIINNTDFIKRVSDNGVYIRCVETGEQFTEAIDPANVTCRTYEETEKTIPEKKEETPQNPLSIMQARRKLQKNI